MSYEAGPRLIPGVKIEMAGRTLIVPPMPLGATKRIARFMDSASGKIELSNEDAQQAMIEAMYLTLRRNYPNITMEDVEADMDSELSAELMEKLNERSGIKKKPGDGDTPLGESNGGSSTAG